MIFVCDTLETNTKSSKLPKVIIRNCYVEIFITLTKSWLLEIISNDAKIAATCVVKAAEAIGIKVDANIHENGVNTTYTGPIAQVATLGRLDLHRILPVCIVLP